MSVPNSPEHLAELLATKLGVAEQPDTNRQVYLRVVRLLDEHQTMRTALDRIHAQTCRVMEDVHD